jgi:hypothetical protein
VRHSTMAALLYFCVPLVLFGQPRVTSSKGGSSATYHSSNSRRSSDSSHSSGSASSSRTNPRSSSHSSSASSSSPPAGTSVPAVGSTLAGGSPNSSSDLMEKPSETPATQSSIAKPCLGKDCEPVPPPCEGKDCKPGASPPPPVASPVPPKPGKALTGPPCFGTSYGGSCSNQGDRCADIRLRLLGTSDPSELRALKAELRRCEAQ